MAGAIERAGAQPARRGPLAWLNPLAVGVMVGVGLSAFEHRRAPAETAVGAAPPPAEISLWLPLGAWRHALARAAAGFGHDQIPAASAATTYFAILALFPAMSAFVSLYGLLADAHDAERLVAGLGGFLPGGAVTVLSDELKRLVEADQGRLGFAFAISVLISLWSANAGVKALMASLNVAYETQEKRGLIQLNLVSLAFTSAAVVIALLVVAAVAATPQMFGRLPGLDLAAILRWPALLVLVALATSVLYRYGPARAQGSWKWVTPGGVLTAALWMAMSALFSWYVANFGHYDKTYGSLGAMVGFLTWVWLSLMVVLLGAELNREVEKAADAKAGARAQ